MLSQAGLPPLAAEEESRSAQIAARIRARAAARGGWLPFSAFMQAALYEPAFGYYMTDRTIFGAAGDYMTAPEMAPLFSRCLAVAIADLLAKAGGGDIVEFGAGSGRMAADVMAALARAGRLPRRYRIVEPSPVLAQRQRRWLARAPGAAGFADRLEWLDAPPAGEWQGVAFANEVIDALPVDRFRIVAQGCEALGVVPKADGFDWQAGPADRQLAAAVQALQERLPERMPPGFVSEIRLGQEAWLAAAAGKLSRGALLLVDYGLPRAQYYHRSRDGGTLCGFRRHRRVEDVLSSPGTQDLTAWVDFSGLADAARSDGMQIEGFATQAHFLLATGVERELAHLADDADERGRVALRQAAATLLLPGEMGERFKVLAVARGIEGPVTGFGFRDLSASL